ncbi:hypothetical protein [Modestobacter sp. SYSU DS0290]
MARSPYFRMSRRTDHLLTGGGLAVGGVALLAWGTAEGVLTAARTAGALLLLAAGVLLVVSGVRGPLRADGSTAPWYRNRTTFGLLLLLMSVELALWSVGMPDRAGRLGAATGFLVVGAVLVIRGVRSRRSTD